MPAGSDALRGAELAIANAERLLHSAQTLAAVGDYPSAVGFLVLASEEAEKSYALGMLSFGTNPDAIGAGPLLSSHKARHERSRVNNLALAMADAAVAHVREAMRLEAEGKLPEPAEMRRRLVDSLVAGASRIGSETPDGERFRRSQDWLNGANRLKQRAFYVDYLGAAWSSPDSLVKSDYLKGLEIASFVVTSRKDLLASIGGMTEDERESILQGMAQVRTIAATHQRAAK